jgi:hypothetical protein
MFKIALLLCGQPRFFEKGFSFLSRNLIDPNKEHEIDVFIHCWHDPDLVGEVYPGAPWNTSQTGMYEEHVPSKLISLYKPKLCIFQKPMTNIELEVKEHDYLPGPGRSNSIPHSLFSQYYSMKRVNELKNEVESFPGNRKYDLVIRTRFDLELKNQIKLFEHTTSNISPMTVWTHNQLVNHTHRAAPELLFFGTSETMDILCGSKTSGQLGLFGNLNIFWEQENLRMSGEDYFAHLIDKNNIEQKVFPFEYGLIRG